MALTCSGGITFAEKAMVFLVEWMSVIQIHSGYAEGQCSIEGRAALAFSEEGRIGPVSGDRPTSSGTPGAKDRFPGTSLRAMYASENAKRQGAH